MRVPLSRQCDQTPPIGRSGRLEHRARLVSRRALARFGDQENDASYRAASIHCTRPAQTLACRGARDAQVEAARSTRANSPRRTCRWRDSPAEATRKSPAWPNATVHTWFAPAPCALKPIPCSTCRCVKQKSRARLIERGCHHQLVHRVPPLARAVTQAREQPRIHRGRA